MSKSLASRKNRSLRAWVIEPFAQIKLGLYVLSLALTFVAILAVLVANAFSEQYQHVMDIFQIVDPSLKLDLVTNDVIKTNSVRILAVLGTFIVVLFAVVFRTTHKYYGPLVNIERFLEGITDGDYTRRVTIRRGDELQDLVKALNEMAESLEKRHGKRVGPAERRRESKVDHQAG